MGENARKIEKLCHRGDHAAVLKATVDRPSGAIPPGAEAWVIGALCFRGRFDEAELLFEGSAPRLTGTARVEARFYLAVARCRRSDYRGARALLGSNVRAVRGHPEGADARSVFFCYQGLAFYRYFQGRFPRALRYGKFAFAGALRARFLFGRAFSQELIGHCLVQVGEVSAGLETLTRAEACAKALGDGGVRQSFRIARASYRAQFGIAPPKSLRELEELYEASEPSLLYSRGVLAIELSRQYLLRGRVRDAKSLLDAVCPAIYGTNHRRQGAALSLRYAEVCYARGENAQALHWVRTASKTLDREVDHALELELLGMEAKLLSALGPTPDLPLGHHLALSARIAAQTRRVGTRVGARILERERARQGSSLTGDARAVEDPLGALLDEVRAQDAASDLASPVAREVRERDYLGLLHPLLGIPRGARVLFVDRDTRTAIRFDQGDVATGASDALTRMMIALLDALASGCEVSKELLVRKIWKYGHYHPHRHDPALYRLVTRLRTTLEDGSSWIEASENGYRVRDGIRVVFSRAAAEQRKASPLERASRLEREPTADAGLNFRQLQILDILAKTRFVSAASCREVLGMSEATARRDLSALTLLRRVQRLGRGRAIRYTAMLEKKGVASHVR